MVFRVELTINDLDLKQGIVTDLVAAPESLLMFTQFKSNLLPEIHVEVTDAPAVKLD